MSSAYQTLVAPRQVRADDRGVAGDQLGEVPGLWPWWLWVLVVVAVFACSTVFVFATGMRPSFDPFGWLAWGHQIIYGHLNLNAAPSWKPLPVIFTLPFALWRGASVQLWSIVAVAGTIAMGVCAARIAYRLAGVGEGSSSWPVVAAWVGALFAGVGVLGIEGLPKLTLIANSDQFNVALVLAALDAHYSRRPRLAYVMLFLAALGRPEAWALAGAYGLWLMWRVPRTRALVLGGWVLIVMCWIIPDALAARSAVQAGKLNLNQKTEIHGNKVIGVLARWAGLYEWPMQTAALIGVALALARRDLRVLGLFGVALFWLVVEIAFAYHGFSSVPRYLMEAGAIMVVVAGIGFGWLLRGLPGVFREQRGRRAAAVAGPLIAVGLLVALAPFADRRAYRWRVGVTHAHAEGIVNRNLSKAVTLAGGSRAILACGPVAALNNHQSQLAWAMNLNVAQVFYKPSLLIRIHMRMVLFTQDGSGWKVRPYNIPADIASRCSRTAVTN